MENVVLLTFDFYHRWTFADTGQHDTLAGHTVRTLYLLDRNINTEMFLFCLENRRHLLFLFWWNINVSTLTQYVLIAPIVPSCCLLTWFSYFCLSTFFVRTYPLILLATHCTTKKDTQKTHTCREIKKKTPDDDRCIRITHSTFKWKHSYPKHQK